MVVNYISPRAGLWLVRGSLGLQGIGPLDRVWLGPFWTTGENGDEGEVGEEAWSPSLVSAASRQACTFFLLPARACGYLQGCVRGAGLG